MTKPSSKTKKKLCAVILAAGNSSRLGRPKQLIPFQEKTLLSHTISQLDISFIDETFVVVGAYERECRHALKDLNISTLTNHNWRTGIGSSIKLALEAATSKNPDLDGLLIAVCDQPLIDRDHYQKMTEEFLQNEDRLVSTQYNDMGGVPCIFPKRYFSILKDIDDLQGAKHLINEIPSTIFIKSEAAKFDVDTVEDILSLRQYEQYFARTLDS